MANADDLTYRLLAENSFDLLCQIDMGTNIRYVSPSSQRILGWTPEEMVGRVLSDFVIPEDLPVLADTVKHAHTFGVPTVSVTIRMHRKQGPFCWLEVNATIVRDPETGHPLTSAVIMRDITDRKILEERLARLALTDGLTGLANRRAFDMTLDAEWKRTLREGSQMSLILLDVDRFKQFNDHYGHQFGDDCLRAVASAVTRTVHRPSDLTARYGGEEIGVILPHTDDIGAAHLAEDIRLAVLDLQIPHIGNPEADSFVSVSLGVATAIARQGATIKMPESLLMCADSALYKAKHGGRNRVATHFLMAMQQMSA